MYSMIGKLLGIVFGVIFVLLVVAFILAIMANGVIIAWNWGELGILFNLTRPLLFSHVFAMLLVLEFFKLPKMIEQVAKHVNGETAKRDELDYNETAERKRRDCMRRTEETSRRMSDSICRLEGLLSKWR